MQGQDLGQNSLLAVVVDHGVAEAHFNFFIYLVAHTLEDFLPREVVALHSAMYPQWQRCVYPNDEVKVSCGGGLEDQGGFADRVGCAAGLRLHPLFPVSDRRGMNEGVQDLELRGVGEDLCGHPGPVECAGFGTVGLRPELGDDVFAQLMVFIHDPFGIPVGIGYGDAEHFEDLCYRTFARSYAAGQTDT